MIFNEMNNTTVSYEAVQESPYELGIGGAFMHVYENECNYNALMKAAALSEMKYYNQTGGDLFVQEAGAFAGFLAKIKAFFMKVIEKIKSIAKKFIAKINQFTMKDKDFVKKYQTELVKRNLKDFEFNGYAFPTWTGNTSVDGAVADVKSDGSDDIDALNDIKEKNRGKIIGGSAMTESEYRDELKEKLYGDKDDIKVNVREQLNIISDTKDLIKAAEKEEKSIIDSINKLIKNLETSADSIEKSIKKDASDASKDDSIQNRNDGIKGIYNRVDVYKALSNDLTVYFGAVTKALADRNRQAKAICVKALSYKPKNESTVVEGSYSDIFAGVEIV